MTSAWQAGHGSSAGHDPILRLYLKGDLLSAGGIGILMSMSTGVGVLGGRSTLDSPRRTSAEKRWENFRVGPGFTDGF